MNIQTKALLVHLLTATGAVFAMLAMLAAVDEKWGLMFLWLVVAFIVDGIDGPLARRYQVKVNAPQYDGVLMDLIIDYLTYVFIPAYALFKSGLMPGWTGWFAIIVITFASVVYFADTRMKTKDNSFSGFPGCWNMVILVLFATEPNFWGHDRAGDRHCIRHVPTPEVHSPRTHRTLAPGQPANGLGVDRICGMGRVGRFPPGKLGALGPCCDLDLPAGCRYRTADHPRKSLSAKAIPCQARARFHSSQRFRASSSFTLASTQSVSPSLVNSFFQNGARDFR